MEGKKDNDYVRLAGTVGGIALVMVFFNFLFVPEYAWVSIFIVMFMVMLGVFLGDLNSKRNIEKKETPTKKKKK